MGGALLVGEIDDLSPIPPPSKKLTIFARRHTNAPTTQSNQTTTFTMAIETTTQAPTDVAATKVAAEEVKAAAADPIQEPAKEEESKESGGDDKVEEKGMIDSGRLVACFVVFSECL